MRYFITVIIVFFQLISTTLGSTKNNIISFKKNNFIVNPSSEESFSEDISFITSTIKQNAAYLSTYPLPQETWKPIKHAATRIYLYNSFSYYLFLKNFLFPKHVFW